MFRISRALKPGQQLTPAQRRSPYFAEEPTVCGKVLRRGMAPMLIDDETFRRNQLQLKRLFDAGSIDIEARAFTEVDGKEVEGWIDLRRVPNAAHRLIDDMLSEQIDEKAEKEAEEQAKKEEKGAETGEQPQTPATDPSTPPAEPSPGTPPAVEPEAATPAPTPLAAMIGKVEPGLKPPTAPAPVFPSAPLDFSKNVKPQHHGKKK